MRLFAWLSGRRGDRPEPADDVWWSLMWETGAVPGAGAELGLHEALHEVWVESVKTAMERDGLV